jgi:hypothetical protein
MATVKDRKAEAPIVRELLDEHYSPRLAAAMLKVSREMGGKSPGEHGHDAELHSFIERRLAGTGLEINPQAVNKYAKGTNSSAGLGRGALDFQSLLSLAVAVFPGNPQTAYSLMSLYLIGQWDPEQIPEKVMRKILETGELPIGGGIGTAKKLDAIHKDTQAIRAMLGSGTAVDAAPGTPVSRALEQILVEADALDYDNLRAIALQFFSEKLTTRLLAILRGEVVVQSSDYASIGILLDAACHSEGRWCATSVRGVVESAIAEASHL